mmetsp:Transcript_112239/g.317959  ORF Transcript_112239/g.317959 Transcript_112239/m.317959 type:complete len:117 (-) Transcript_112239:336-686(-)
MEHSMSGPGWCAFCLARHVMESCALGPFRLGHSDQSSQSNEHPRGSHVTHRVSTVQNSSKQGSLTGGWWGSYHSGGSIVASVENVSSDDSVMKDIELGRRLAQHSVRQQAHQQNPQ